MLFFSSCSSINIIESRSVASSESLLVRDCSRIIQKLFKDPLPERGFFSKRSDVFKKRITIEIQGTVLEKNSTILANKMRLGKKINDNVLMQTVLIDYEIDDLKKSYHMLEILPEGSTPLNSFVRRMSKLTDGTRVFIGNKEVMDGASGAYYKKLNAIFLDPDSFDVSKVASKNSTLFHEFRHALKYYQLKNGHYSPYHGDIASASERPLAGLRSEHPYSNGYSFDESQTFRDDIRREFRILKEALNDKYQNENIEDLIRKLKKNSEIGSNISLSLKRNLELIDDKVIKKSVEFYWHSDHHLNKTYIMAGVDIGNTKFTFEMNEFDDDFLKAWNTTNRSKNAEDRVREAFKKRISDLSKAAVEDSLKMEIVKDLISLLKPGKDKENSFYINAFETGINAAKRNSVSDSRLIKKVKELNPELSIEMLLYRFTEALKNGVRKAFQKSGEKEVISYRVDDEEFNEFNLDGDKNLSYLFSRDGEFLDATELPH